MEKENNEKESIELSFYEMIGLFSLLFKILFFTKLLFSLAALPENHSVATFNIYSL